jgi:hypothetical protein
MDKPRFRGFLKNNSLAGFKRKGVFVGENNCAWCNQALSNGYVTLKFRDSEAYFCSDRCLNEWRRAGKPAITAYRQPKGKFSLGKWLKDAITKPTE